MAYVFRALLTLDDVEVYCRAIAIEGSLCLTTKHRCVAMTIRAG